MSACRSCAAPIRWAKTLDDKNMPLDSEPDGERGNVRLLESGEAQVLGPLEVELARVQGEPLYLSHFATCPEATAWREKNKAARS